VHSCVNQFRNMSLLKALAAGFLIVLSLVVFTLVYSFIAANFQGPNVKATSLWILLLSPYYWLLLILLVAFEAWWLMRH
jgi:hypothetical protein